MCIASIATILRTYLSVWFYIVLLKEILSKVSYENLSKHHSFTNSRFENLSI